MNRRRVVAVLMSTLLFGVAVAPGAAADSAFADLTWDQKNQWLLTRIMSPADATRFLGVSGLTMTEGGEDRLCTPSSDQGVKCSDKWGGGSWNEAYAGQEWPAVAIPRYVSVGWSSTSEAAKQALALKRRGFGVTEDLPLQVSGYNDYGGRYPVGWSDRISDGWYISAYCDPAVRWDRAASKYIYQPVSSNELVDCAKSLVRQQFAQLGVDPVEVTAPDPPTGVLLNVAGKTATVTWIAPENDGGAAITGYDATSSDGALTCSAAPAAKLIQSCIVEGPKPGVTYTFTVVARNQVGASIPSAPSRPSSFTARTSAPRSAVAKLAGTTADLTWKRPMNLGGLPILRYIVSASPGSLSCETKSLSCSIAGLENSTRYRFQVRAINGRGSSAAATTRWVRTAAGPAPVAPAPISVPTPELPVEPSGPPKPEPELS